MEEYIKELTIIIGKIKAELKNKCKNKEKETKKIINVLDPFINNLKMAKPLTKEKSKNIIDNYPININIKEVNHINDIPNFNLYYIKNYKKYGFILDDNLIYGSIGNIVDKKSSECNITNCKFGINCRALLNNECKFYHEPECILQLAKEKKISQDKKENLLNNKKNFSNGSWIYTSKSKKARVKNMRHVGGLNTLLYDIEILKLNPELLNNEIEKRKSQLIHDMLILNLLFNVK